MGINITKTMSKNLMNGMIKDSFRTKSESIKLHGAIQEFIDDAIDAKAKNVFVELNTEKSVFLCADDGCGMTKEQLEKYKLNYSFHDCKGFENTIGSFGVGSKNGMIKIADHFHGSDAYITSWVNPDEMWRLHFIISDDRELEFLDAELEKVDNKEFIKRYGTHGTVVSIKNIKDVDGDRQWQSNLFKEIGKAYPYIKTRDNINIIVNGNNLEYGIDKMYLNVLGDDISIPGIHVKDNLIFNVKVYTLRNGKDTRNLKVVYLYVPKEYAKIIRNDKNKIIFNDKDYDNGGLYTMYNGRYLNVPEHNVNNLPFKISYQGGTGLCRALLIVENNEDILRLRMDKNKGVDISSKNSTLYSYSLVNTNGTKFTEQFEHDFKRLGVISDFQSHGLGESPIEFRKVDYSIAKKIFDNVSSEAASKEYDGITKKNRKEPSQNKCKTTPTIAPISVSEEEETEIKTIVDSELEAACKGVEEANDNKPVIELHVNKTTGKTEYEFTESRPQFCNDDYIDKLFNILMEEGITKTKVIRICSKMAYSMAAAK